MIALSSSGEHNDPNNPWYSGSTPASLGLRRNSRGGASLSLSEATELISVLSFYSPLSHRCTIDASASFDVCAAIRRTTSLWIVWLFLCDNSSCVSQSVCKAGTWSTSVECSMVCSLCVLTILSQMWFTTASFSSHPQSLFGTCCRILREIRGRCTLSIDSVLILLLKHVGRISQDIVLS